MDLDTTFDEAQLKVNHLFLEQRKCRACGETKNLLADFYLSRKDPTLLSSYTYECKECTKIRVTKNHRKNPGKQRNNDLKRLYGINLEDYNKLLTEQNNCCAICGADKPGGKNPSFNVDHCHTTGKVRGLLCKSCNIALGEFKDDVDTLQKAVLYLQKNNR
jgi:ribosomal protein S14